MENNTSTADVPSSVNAEYLSSIAFMTVLLLCAPQLNHSWTRANPSPWLILGPELIPHQGLINVYESHHFISPEHHFSRPTHHFLRLKH